MAKEIKNGHQIVQASDFLRDQFGQFDERWIVGHKGDHLRNLVELGIVDSAITVAHVHSTLGVKADKVLMPPPEASVSYEGYLRVVNPEIRGEVRRVIDTHSRAVVLMPFPNEGLERIIHEEGARDRFVRTAPIADFSAFQPIEDKISFSRMLKEVLSGTPFQQNIIPWTVLNPNMTLADIYADLGIKGASVYLQKALSGGGDGTVRIESQQELNALMQDIGWLETTRLGKVKAAMGIENAYPANGTGCIVPTPDGNCTVLVDPLSHKPVGLKSLNTSPESGVGNDWSQSFSAEIQQQYIGMVSLIGQHLYREYGYTGIFGPDGLIAPDSDKPLSLYQLTEVNSRWQGTTPYQTQNALMNGRLPLELVHYMVKLANGDKSMLAATHDIIGDSSDYNEKAVEEKGGFYIKMGAPTQRKEVVRDLNGAWKWNGAELTPISNGKTLDSSAIYSRRFDRAQFGLDDNEHIVYIKGPKPGEMVGGQLVSIGYISGSGLQVFQEQIPDVTPDGLNLYTQAETLMFRS